MASFMNAIFAYTRILGEFCSSFRCAALFVSVQPSGSNYSRWSNCRIAALRTRSACTSSCSRAPDRFAPAPVLYADFAYNYSHFTLRLLAHLPPSVQYLFFNIGISKKEIPNFYAIFGYSMKNGHRHHSQCPFTQEKPRYLVLNAKGQRSLYCIHQL